jgi:hypothetical protein
MESYRLYSWVLKLERCLSHLAPHGCFAGFGVLIQGCLAFLWQRIYHVSKFRARLNEASRKSKAVLGLIATFKQELAKS